MRSAESLLTQLMMVKTGKVIFLGEGIYAMYEESPLTRLMKVKTMRVMRSAAANSMTLVMIRYARCQEHTKEIIELYTFQILVT
ncbi:hypothetical protein ACJIZ3_014450 [Penstemon smallii]|uniref:Uncharacterized protein n=1 Tax=Penstemon smallii TaxID=265156 RepID=A0ABD3RJL1_9LAMI